jgi:alpha-ketoglutarate-dependent taurine dioxygenase
MTPYTIKYEDIDSKNLKKDLLTHGLLYIPCKNALSIDEYKKITSKLGKALIAKKHTLDDDRHVQYVSDKGLFSNTDVDWHNDWSYGSGDYFGTVLYNNKNGHLSTTDFVDMQQAYNMYLDKEYLENTCGDYFPPQGLHESCFTPRMLKILERARVTRKFAHTHHITGNKVLYFSPGTLQSDVDIAHLVDYCEQQEIYKHNWQDNDILIYDNIRVMHRRHAFEGERELWRTQFWI